MDFANGAIRKLRRFIQLSSSSPSKGRPPGDGLVAPKQPWVVGLSYLLAFIGCLAICVRLSRDSDRFDRQDFNRYYADATVLHKGGNPWQSFERLPSESQEERQVGYPPAFYLMFSQLTRLRPEPAHWMWEALQIISLVSALIIVFREVGLTAHDSLTRFAFAFACFFPPLHSALHWGQPTPLLLLLLVASWATARRGWDIMAGALLAVATLLKVFPGVTIGYFLFRRRWTVLASSLILTVTFALCLVALYGFYRNLDFLRGTSVSTTWLDRRRNLSIIGNLHVLLLTGVTAGSSANAYLLSLLILLAISVVAIAGTITWRAPDERVTSSGLCWSLWVVSSILLSPVAWDHYLVLLIPLYVFLAVEITGYENSSIHRTCGWSYSLGIALVVGGLVGFMLLPYFAAARHARGYFVLVLMSYAGLCLMGLRQVKELKHGFAEP